MSFWPWQARQSAFGKAEQLRVNGDEQKPQKQTQFVRRRRRVFDSNQERKKNPLQRPASLEMTPLPEKWVLEPRCPAIRLIRG